VNFGVNYSKGGCSKLACEGTENCPGFLRSGFECFRLQEGSRRRYIHKLFCINFETFVTVFLNFVQHNNKHPINPQFFTLLENWETLITCTEKYVDQKCALAAGSLPDETRNLLEDLRERNLILSAWPAGAGGGGFLYLLLKNPENRHQIEEILARNEVVKEIYKMPNNYRLVFQSWSSMTVHNAEITENAVIFSEEK